MHTCSTSCRCCLLVTGRSSARQRSSASKPSAQYSVACSRKENVTLTKWQWQHVQHSAHRVSSYRLTDLLDELLGANPERIAGSPVAARLHRAGWLGRACVCHLLVGICRHCRSVAYTACIWLFHSRTQTKQVEVSGRTPRFTILLLNLNTEIPADQLALRTLGQQCVLLGLLRRPSINSAVRQGALSLCLIKTRRCYLPAQGLSRLSNSIGQTKVRHDR